MKYGDIVKLNGILGDVVTGDNAFYFRPVNYGSYYCSDLQEITDDILEQLTCDIIEQATFDEKVKFIEESFSWGKVIKTHNIGEYQIIEYVDKENQILFHIYINFKDNGCSYKSLDAALIGVITQNKIEVNAARHATNFIFKMLDMPNW
jgi:hypothetical protein